MKYNKYKADVNVKRTEIYTLYKQKYIFYGKCFQMCMDK